MASACWLDPRMHFVAIKSTALSLDVGVSYDSASRKAERNGLWIDSNILKKFLIISSIPEIRAGWRMPTFSSAAEIPAAVI